MVLLKRFILLFFLFDNFIVQNLKKIFPHRHKITGTCKKCGQCCKGIYLKMTPSQIQSEFFRTLCIRWISWLFDFILLKIDFENRSLVFTCKHVGADGRCQNYFWRPPVCRNYPLLDYFKEPVFLPGCGYAD